VKKTNEDLWSSAYRGSKGGRAYSARGCLTPAARRWAAFDPPYLNAVEHDHRYPPEDHLIEQLAKILGISADVLYFHANRQPADVKTEGDQARVEAAYRAFRKVLGVKLAGKRK